MGRADEIVRREGEKIRRLEDVYDAAFAALVRLGDVMSDVADEYDALATAVAAVVAEVESLKAQIPSEHDTAALDAAVTALQGLAPAPAPVPSHEPTPAPSAPVESKPPTPAPTVPPA
jgi:hypothetical protein